MDWLGHLEPVHQRPGRWARVARFRYRDSAERLAIALRASGDFDAGWTFAARPEPAGGSRLYARYDTRPGGCDDEPRVLSTSH